ncbi:MAG: hypothetical protein MK098_15405 [Marinovum sp.]|nr:hypothetical protein [Marinovum sp.]
MQLHHGYTLRGVCRSDFLLCHSDFRRLYADTKECRAAHAFNDWLKLVLCGGLVQVKVVCEVIEAF